MGGSAVGGCPWSSAGPAPDQPLDNAHQQVNVTNARRWRLLMISPAVW